MTALLFLDTNVVSEPMRPAPSEAVLSWLDNQRSGDLFISAVTVAEALFGIALLPAGRRRTGYEDRFYHMLEEDFAGRVWSFDINAAQHFFRDSIRSPRVRSPDFGAGLSDWRNCPIKRRRGVYAQRR